MHDRLRLLLLQYSTSAKAAAAAAAGCANADNDDVSDGSHLLSEHRYTVVNDFVLTTLSAGRAVSSPWHATLACIK